jgi:hypothetical protein
MLSEEIVPLIVVLINYLCALIHMQHSDPNLSHSMIRCMALLRTPPGVVIVLHAFSTSLSPLAGLALFRILFLAALALSAGFLLHLI